MNGSGTWRMSRRAQRSPQPQDRDDTLDCWFESSPDPLFLLDERGCMVRCNEAGRAALSGTPRPGVSLHACVPKRWRGVVKTTITRCCRERRPLEVELRESAFQVTKMLVRPFVRRSDDLVLAQLVTTASQKALRTERVARRRAEQASVAKSNFLASMSHEIRTPLGGVIGYTDLLANNPHHPDRIDWANDAHRCASHLLALLNGILDLSKIEAGELKMELAETNLQSVIEEVGAAMRPLAMEREARLHCSVAGSDANVQTDALRLRQILINLTQNALRFTPGGDVFVSAQVQSGPGGRRMRLEVRDTGCGIPADKLEHVFKPFTQLKDASGKVQIEGTGLGLQITTQLVRLLGGTVQARSEVGVGTTFVIDLPAGEPRPAAQPRSREQLAPAGCPRNSQLGPCGHFETNLSGLRVLVVDDHGPSRKLTEIRLEALNAEVVSVCDGAQAVERAQAEDFALIFMDMRMPVMDGYTATRTLRQGGLETPVIALTAHAMAGDRERCRSVGCTDYLTKPIEPGSLNDCLQRVLFAGEAKCSIEGRCQPCVRDSQALLRKTLSAPARPQRATPPSAPRAPLKALPVVRSRPAGAREAPRTARPASAPPGAAPVADAPREAREASSAQQRTPPAPSAAPAADALGEARGASAAQQRTPLAPSAAPAADAPGEARGASAAQQRIPSPSAAPGSKPEPQPAPRSSRPDPLAALRREYVADLANMADEVRLALSEGDAKVVRTRAHQLSGTAKAFGFPLLGQLAREVDERLREGASLRTVSHVVRGLLQSMRAPA